MTAAPRGLNEPDPTLDDRVLRSLRGGAAKDSFQLDGGRFRLEPPGGRDRATVGADDATCWLLATNWGHTQLVRLAGPSSVAIGYGRVTIDPSLVPPASEPALRQPGRVTPPVFPTYHPYRSQLAWIAIVQPGPSGCATSGNSDTASATSVGRTSAAPGRIIVVLDAATGGNGAVYSESSTDPCSGSLVGAHLDRATMPVSVTWRQRGPATRAGLPVTASLLSCDGYTDPILTNNGPRSEIDPATFRGPVRVVARRPLGVGCGSVRSVALTVKPPTTPYNSWEKLTHAPTGVLVRSN